MSAVITLEKLKVFESFNGDIDMWSRVTAKVGSPIKGDEWRLIETLLQDSIVIDRNLGSDERTKQASERLLQNCENDAVIAEIRRVARKLSPIDSRTEGSSKTNLTSKLVLWFVFLLSLGLISLALFKTPAPSPWGVLLWAVLFLYTGYMLFFNKSE